MAAERVLILGHSGLVGRALLAAGGESCIAPQGGREQFDLTEPRTLERLLADTRPTAVINCAAFTNVDACEAQPELAMAVNAQGPGALARACAAAGVHLTHLSTDFVFGHGHQRPISESEAPAPLSVYGQSKLAGEQLVAQAGGENLVVRVAWVFGPAKPTLVDKLLGLVRRGEEVRVVTDQVGSPTYSVDLAPALLELSRRRVTGLMHAVNKGQVSRFGQITRAVQLAGLDVGLVKPVLTRDLGPAAERPAYSALDTRRLGRIIFGGLPTWTDALARHLGATSKGDCD